MDSLQDTTLSSDNWLLNYVEAAKTIRPPLDSRVRTRMWVYHHFFSESAKSNWEAMDKEGEPQRKGDHLVCHENRPNGGKLGQVMAQRIARKSTCGKINIRGGSLREAGKRRNVSDTSVPDEIPNKKFRGPSHRNISTTMSLLRPSPLRGYREAGVNEYSLPVNYAELPLTSSDDTSSISSASPPQSTQQSPQTQRCNVWTEVFLNNTRYLVLDTSKKHITQNPICDSSSAGEETRKDRKRQHQCDEVTSSSPKRLRM